MSLKTSVLSVAAVTVAFASGLVASRVLERESSAAGTYDASAFAPPAPQTRAANPGRSVGGQLPDLSDVAEQAVRASVNISSTQQVQTDPFMQLFMGADAVRSQTSLGSGVVVSSDGYVLTNSHVVGDRSAQVQVTMSDNNELPARIVGVDPYTDLAVLKIEGKGLAALPWGDSSKLRVAEWVLAVGNPFAFNQTVTLGIVSAQNRHDPQLATYNDFIQTDAAINPGNSGGALVNSRGELIGINTMIYGNQSGGFLGIGFAIPANLARRIMTELIKNREIVRGWIGNPTLYTVSPEQARRAKLDVTGGVFVYTMYRNDPSYRAGLMPGDIIVRFNKTTITEQSQLLRLIADTPIGSTATLEVIRNGERRSLQMPILRAPQVAQMRR